MKSLIAFPQNKVPVPTGETIRLLVELTASKNLTTSLRINPFILNFILELQHN